MTHFSEKSVDVSIGIYFVCATCYNEIYLCRWNSIKRKAVEIQIIQYYLYFEIKLSTTILIVIIAKENFTLNFSALYHRRYLLISSLIIQFIMEFECFKRLLWIFYITFEYRCLYFMIYIVSIRRMIRFISRILNVVLSVNYIYSFPFVIFFIY